MNPETRKWVVVLLITAGLLLITIAVATVRLDEKMEKADKRANDLNDLMCSINRSQHFVNPEIPDVCGDPK